MTKSELISEIVGVLVDMPIEDLEEFHKGVFEEVEEPEEAEGEEPEEAED